MDNVNTPAKCCYQCGHENPDQPFCGTCGSPLTLSDYIAKGIKEQLSTVIRDRDVLETESSIKVFEKAWGWVKIIGGVSAVLLAILGAGVFWKVSDWWSSVNTAKQAVIETSTTARTQIARSSSQSLQDITEAAKAAKDTIGSASNEATRQSDGLRKSLLETKGGMSREAAALRTDIESSRSQLQAANKLQPEMASLRQQLTQATADIQTQQKVISSSEEFVKGVFSSHVVEFFHIGQPPENLYTVIAPPSGGSRTTVFFVLRSTPISQTLQLQFHIYAQPQDSFINIHNLMIFSWGDSLDSLKAYQLSISYFPDKSDKNIIHSLTQHDGRVFADNEPLPKFNQPDPDFKGNKWFEVRDGKIAVK